MSSERERLAEAIRSAYMAGFTLAMERGEPRPELAAQRFTDARMKSFRAAALLQEPPTPEAMRAWAEWFDDPNRSPSMSVQPSPVHALRFAPGYLLRLIADEMEQPTDKE